jgi:uncharacterized repeat protein (TIGR01451 family)
VWNLTDTLDLDVGVPVLLKLDERGAMYGCCFRSEPAYTTTHTTSPFQALSVPAFDPHVVAAEVPEATQAIAMPLTTACEDPLCISVAKSGPSSSMADGLITYTLTVTNSGLVTVTGLAITDSIPTRAHYITGGTRLGDVLSWSVESLAVGESARVTFAVTMTEGIVNIGYRASADEDHVVTGPAVVTTRRDCGARINDDPTEYPTVQAAVDAAAAGDTVKIAGHCTGVDTRDGLPQIVYVSRSITLSGGYAATNWTAPDPRANPTTLDARGQGRVLYITGAPSAPGRTSASGQAPAAQPGQTISVIVEGLRITGGDATGLGGGMLGKDAGGGVYVIDANVIVSNNQVFSSTAADGGGLFLRDSDALVDSNVFTGSTATFAGGGLNLQASYATLINNLVADNQTENRGGGLFVRASSPRLLHTTIASNIGGDGSGIFVTNWGEDASTVWLTNTILASQDVGVKVTTGNTATLDGMLWGDGTWANGIDWNDAGAVITSAHDYWGDPGFVDPAGGNYHIGPGSAALDAGVDGGIPWDIDGEPRPFGGGFDLGADEFSAALIVTKEVRSRWVQASWQLSYTIRVTNTGGVDLHATITDTLFESITSTSPLSGTVIVPGGQITWTAVITAPGGAWMETVAVTMAKSYAGTLVNRVEVTTEEGAAGAAHAVVSRSQVYLPLVMRSYGTP